MLTLYIYVLATNYMLNLELKNAAQTCMLARKKDVDKRQCICIETICKNNSV